VLSKYQLEPLTTYQWSASVSDLRKVWMVVECGCFCGAKNRPTAVSSLARSPASIHFLRKPLYNAVGIGLTIYLRNLCNTANIAHQIATLNQLSGDRLELGVRGL
jgi:hypothetical protein